MVFPYVFFALIVFILFRVPLFDSTVLISNGDLHNSHYFFWSFVRDNVFAGKLPLWNPYVFSGYPFLSNPSVNVFYPPNWLLLVFPLNIGFAINIAFHIWFAMAGMCLLLTNIVRLKNRNSIFDLVLPPMIAGIVFGLSGVFSSHIYGGNYDVIAASSWLPWTFLSCWLVFNQWRWKRFVVAVFVLSLQILSGYQTQTLMTLEAVGMTALLFCLLKRSFVPLLSLAGIVVASLGMTAFQLLPMQHNVSLSVRSWGRFYNYASIGSMPFSSFFQLLSPFALGDQYTYRVNWMGYWEHACFVGRMTLVFVIFAISQWFVSFIKILKKISVSLRFIGATVGIVLVIFSVWASMGDLAPFDLYKLLWTFVPGYSVLRIPARHLFLFVFGMALLSGIGFDVVIKIFRKKAWMSVLFAILIIADLTMYASHLVESRPRPELIYDQEIMEPLKQASPMSRVAHNVPYIPLDSAMREKFFSANGYDVVTLRNYFDFVSAANDFSDIFWSDISTPIVRTASKGMQYLGIEYLIIDEYDGSTKPIPSSMTRLRLDETHGFAFYKNTNFLPRFFLVPTITMLPTRDAVYEAIRKESIDYTKTVIVDASRVTRHASKLQNLNASTLQPCDNATLQQSTVSIVSYETNRIVLHTNTSCSGYLASSEVMYPGWTATIDGMHADLFEGNLAFRTMALPAGVHTVIWEYRPMMFVYGGIITAITVILLACVSAVLWKKHKKTYQSKETIEIQ